jgi:hypothetical protein
LTRLVVPPRRLVLPQLTVIQSATGWTASSTPADVTVNLGRAPSQPLLGFTSSDSAVGNYLTKPQTGAAYKWWGPVASSGPLSSYGSSGLWVGKRLGAEQPVVGTHLYSGGVFPDASVVEIAGLLGEVVWTTALYASGTGVTLDAPPWPIWEAGLLLVTGGRFKSGGSGGATPSVSPSQGAAISSTGGGVLGRLTIYRYIPGTRPVVSWSFARSTACSAFAAIMR